MFDSVEILVLRFDIFFWHKPCSFLADCKNHSSSKPWWIPCECNDCFYQYIYGMWSTLLALSNYLKNWHQRKNVLTISRETFYSKKMFGVNGSQTYQIENSNLCNFISNFRYTLKFRSSYSVNYLFYGTHGHKISQLNTSISWTDDFFT